MLRIRKRIYRSWWSVLMTLAMLLSLVSTTAFASSAMESISPMAKVESELLTQISTTGETTFWVYFENQPDLSPAYAIEDWTERGWFVYETLRKHAAESQAGTIAYLEKMGIKHEPFWIANTIKVEGDYNTLMELASMPNVRTVTADKVYALVTPLEGKEELSINSVEWGVANIKADQVWSTFGVRGEGVVVGSIDTGVLYTHPALVNQYRGNNGDGTFDHNYNWHDPSNICGGSAPCDNNGHGTHVHGTMGGWDGADNQIGVAPAAQWMAAKGCESNSCSQSALLSSGQFMVAPTNLQGQNPDPSKRPHVLNNSWGGSSTSDPWYAPTVEAWVAAGIFPQFANGNSGPGCATAGNPGNHPLSYAAGAYDINNNIASFSSRGPSAWGGIIKPNIAAPGVNVRSAWNNGGYNSISGTSMASPHVAGAVALMMSAAPSLIGDVDAVKALLNESAIDTPNLTCGGTPENNNVFGEGRLDALAAVDLSPRGPMGALAGTVTDADSGAPIAGASVTVTGGSTNRTASTNAAGQYSFNLPVGTYSLTVARFGYLNGSANGVNVTEGDTTTQNFALQSAPSGSLSGVVRNQSDQPVAGARVEILGTPIPAATTGADGSYTFTTVPHGSYQVQASAGRCNTPQTRGVTIGGSENLDFLLPNRDDAFGYTCTIVEQEFEQAADVIPVTGDDVWRAIELPFPFSFYGETYEDAWVCTNGIVGFGSSGSCPFSNRSIPDTATPNAAIYPFWDDLYVDASASIRSELKGEAPNRRFVIEFRNIAFFSPRTSRIDFNVVLYENGQILTQYLNLTDAQKRGNSATVGLENHSGTVALQYSFNEDALYSGLGILYRLPPSGFVTGTVTDLNDGEPIAGATVNITQSGAVIRSIVTNAEGEYRAIVPLGDYGVEVNSPNYIGALESVSLTGEGDEANASFALATARADVGPEALEFLLTADKGRSQALTITNTGSATLEFTAAVSGAEWLTFSPAEGALAPGESLALTAIADTTGMEPGVYVATIALATNSGRQAHVNVPVTLVLASYQQGVNAGSSQGYTDSLGDDWAADQQYTEGGYGYTNRQSRDHSTKSTIAGTTEQELYQVARIGAEEYVFDVPENGVYQVELYFAEIQGSGNNRLFDVLIEGEVVLFGYNVASQVGTNAADAHVFLVQVTDGQVNIRLQERRGQTDPLINAIRVTHRSDL